MGDHDYEFGYLDGYDRKAPAQDSSEYMRGYECGLEIEQPTMFYHRTEAAEQILGEGFRDQEGSYGLVHTTLCGVFISDIPVDANEGAKGDQLLSIEFPSAVDLREFEIIEPLKWYREWCVPARLLNESCSITLVADDT